MNRCLYALALATVTIPVSVASADSGSTPAKPGTMIGCVLGMKGDAAKRSGLAIFLPETGQGRHAMSPDQVFNPDNLLNEGGFDKIEVRDGQSELTGKNKMTLKFLGGEIYEGTLQGRNSAASTLWCVVSEQPDAKSGFADFGQTLSGLRRPSVEAEDKSQ